MEKTQTKQTQPDLTPDEERTWKQSVEQDNARALQEGTPNTNKAVQESMRPNYSNWPTSRPGPLATQPPPGQRPINPLRAEQMVEIGYDQETGEPSTLDASRSMPDPSMEGRVSPDQLEEAATPQKRKNRL